MREIKFRLWDKRNNGWANDFFIDLDGFLICDPPGTLFIRSDFELMQYTGLKDVNGKEIYEGDIVKNLRDKLCLNHEVIFDMASFGINTGFTHISFSSLNDEDNINIDLWEVIGNIYENPELINKNED